MKKRVKDTAVALWFCLLALAALAGVVMVFVGIWGDWRWIPTGIITTALAVSVIGVSSEVLS